MGSNPATLVSGVLGRVVGLACWMLLAVSGAQADEAAQARAHYEAAQHYYDRGAYDQAIVEFEAAYRLKPHPNVLYNIAQAYERLLDYGRSVRYFERYLADAPKDAEFRALVDNPLPV